MHNLCMLVTLIEGIVETVHYVSAMGIIIADVICLCMCSVGRGTLSGILVEDRNGTEICSGGGEFVVSLGVGLNKTW